VTGYFAFQMTLGVPGKLTATALTGEDCNGAQAFLLRTGRFIPQQKRRKIVSMTPEAYENKKWRGLNNLQSALSRTKLGDHHYGYSGARYNKFESLSDLLEISLIVLENLDEISYSGGVNTAKEMESLADEIQYNAVQLSEISCRLKNEAERWAQSALRPIS
jgi:hypothetical protein